MKLLDMIGKYQELLETKDQLADATKKNNEAIKEMKQQIADQMLDDDCPSIGLGDYIFSLQVKTHYAKKSEADLAAAGLDFFDVLRDQGMGDLIVETVNSRTLESTIRNMVEEQGDMTDELKEVINSYDETDIARRKQSSKALKTAKGGKK